MPTRSQLVNAIKAYNSTECVRGHSQKRKQQLVALCKKHQIPLPQNATVRQIKEAIRERNREDCITGYSVESKAALEQIAGQYGLNPESQPKAPKKAKKKTIKKPEKVFKWTDDKISAWEERRKKLLKNK